MTDKQKITKIYNAFMQLECALGKMFATQEQLQPDTKFYTNIPFHYDRFIERLEKVIQIPNKECPKFLDVGCGFGIKCRIANAMGLETYGIDINQKYIEIAQSMENSPKYKTINALEFTNYHQFDIIYWYTPMKTEMEKFNRHIMKHASKHSILLPAITTNESLQSDWIYSQELACYLHKDNSNNHK